MSGGSFRAYDLFRSKTSVKMNEQELAMLKERLINPPPDCLFSRNARVIDRPRLFGEEAVAVEPFSPEERFTHTFVPRFACEKVG